MKKVEVEEEVTSSSHVNARVADTRCQVERQFLVHRSHVLNVEHQ